MTLSFSPQLLKPQSTYSPATLAFAWKIPWMEEPGPWGPKAPDATEWLNWNLSFWRMIGNTKRRQEEPVGVGEGGWGSRRNSLGWNLMMLPKEFRDVPFSSPLSSSAFPVVAGNAWRMLCKAWYSHWTLFNPWHNMVSLLKLIKNKWKDFPPNGLTVHLHSAFQSASLQGDRAKYGP